MMYSWIVSQYFPKNYTDMTYVELFGGAGHVWWEKDTSRMEVYNDLDGSINAILALCADPYLYRKLTNLLIYGTPFEEIEACWKKYPFGAELIEEMHTDFPHNYARHVADLIQGLSVSQQVTNWHERLAVLRDSFSNAALEQKDPVSLIQRYSDSNDTFLFCWAPNDYDHKSLGEALFEVKNARWLAVARAENAHHYEGTRHEHGSLVLIK